MKKKTKDIIQAILIIIAAIIIVIGIIISIIWPVLKTVAILKWIF